MAISPKHILAALGGHIAGSSAGAAAQGHLINEMREEGKDDRINRLQAWLMAKRHLGPGAQTLAQPGLNNAYYTKTRDGNPLIVYDPDTMTRSTMAHEIGHGLQDKDGALSHKLYGTSRAFGPLTSMIGGGMLADKALRRKGLATMGVGAAISVPHLVEEAVASLRARKLLDGDSKGLGEAWGTYAVGALGAPAAAGASTYGISKAMESPALKSGWKKLLSKARKFVGAVK